MASGRARPVAGALAATAVLGLGALLAQGLSALATAAGNDPRLTVERSGVGRVTSDPAGIDCGTDCQEAYPSSTTVRLIAEPRNGSTFTGWGGDCANAKTQSTCTVVLRQDTKVSAAFQGGTAHPGPSPTPSPTPTPTPTATPTPTPTATPTPTPATRRTLSGTRFADVIRGTSRPERFLLGGGDDQGFGGGGADIVCGEAGADRLHGDAGADRLYGDTCPTRRAVRAAADRLLGGSGDDFLVGGGGRDRLLGGTGRDELRARDGWRDLVDCGRGHDRAIVDRLDRVIGCERVLRG